MRALIMEDSARTPKDPVDKLHEEAGKVQETLKRLLGEIHHLLEKTKGIIKDMDQPETRSKPES
jgi:hypothetical protein